MNISSLDQIVLQSLDFFATNPPQKFNLGNYKLPFVVGSGNAFNTGKIIFSQTASIFADETNFKQLIESYSPIINQGLIKQAVIISASGEKDSVWEVELAKKYGLATTLLTCKPNSSAAKLADQTLGFKSIAEPYTYNTSTYLGMILAATNENPADIKKIIQDTSFPQNFNGYSSYAFILPDEYGNIAPMIDIKRDELFGPHLVIRAYPQGHARHAKFIHRWDQELVISINQPNPYYGHPNHRWQIDLPSSTSFATILALTYYICGRIQSLKPKYFETNISEYCSDYGPKAYGKDQIFEIIVPANN